MHNESTQTSAECVDDDCNVILVDVDGDGIPDYVSIRIRWLLASIFAVASGIFSQIL